MSDRFRRIPNPTEYLAQKRDKRRKAYSNFVSYWSSIKLGPNQTNPDIVGSALNEAQVAPDWQEELASLKLLIEETRIAFEDQNPISLRGFEKIRRGFNEIHNPDRLTLSDTAVGTLTLFEDSYKKYSVFNERPLQNHPRGLDRYKRLNRTLTPRDIRLVVKSYGLNGRVESTEELTRLEGFSGVSATKNSILSGKNNIIWRLKDLQLEIENRELSLEF